MIKRILKEVKEYKENFLSCSAMHGRRSLAGNFFAFFDVFYH